MHLSHFRAPLLALAGTLLFAAAADAAPPPGMRWGDHSGLSPSGRAAGRAVRPGPTVYAPTWGRPVAWPHYHYHYPYPVAPTIVRPFTPPGVILGPVVPAGPSVVVPAGRWPGR